MSLLHLNRNPSQSELTTFGRLLPAFGALVSASLWWRNDSWRAAVSVVGVSVSATLLFFLVARWQKPIYLGWMYVVYPIGWSVSHLVMAAIYFMVITPIGVAVPIVARRPSCAAIRAECWELLASSNGTS